MVILILLVSLILMEVCSFNTLATPIHFVQELPEQSSIMFQLVNIDSGFFLERTFCVHVGYTLSKPNNISCMSVRGLIITGIQVETLLVILQYSLNLTTGYFLSQHNQSYSFLFTIFFFLFLFLLFSLSFSFQCWLSLPICSYKVATTVCPCILCNKLLIFFKKKHNMMITIL